MSQIGGAALIIGLAATVGSILLAEDRRRAVRRLGIAAVIGGLFIVALLFVATWLIGRQIEDAQLADAIKGALGEATDDLRLTGLWIAAYGLVVAAAAASTERRYTPAEVWNRARGWIGRRQQTTWGTILLGVLGLLISIVFIQEPLGNFELLIRAAALWVGYLAVTEILRLVRVITEKQAERRALWPRLATVGAAIVVIAGMVTVGFVVTTRGAANSAQASEEQVCNGENSLCDLRIDQVTFPGVHHAFASSEYPGYLFAQQVGTITDQLRAGVRALNIDTHYGEPSTARIPGQNVPIVLTDKVATEVARANAEQDPVAEKRAAQLAAGAPKAADAQRGIYMCHSNCETGAIKFGDGLEEIKTFLDSHPDDVLMLTLHDFTSPADTAAAIEASGLADRAYTLQPGEPLPTLRTLIDNGQTLLVFAERATPAARPGTTTCTTGSRRPRSRSPTRNSSTARRTVGSPTRPCSYQPLAHVVSARPDSRRSRELASRSQQADRAVPHRTRPRPQHRPGPIRRTRRPHLHREIPQRAEAAGRAHESRAGADTDRASARGDSTGVARRRPGHPDTRVYRHHDLDRRGSCPLLSCFPGGGAEHHRMGGGDHPSRPLGGGARRPRVHAPRWSMTCGPTWPPPRRSSPPRRSRSPTAPRPRWTSSAPSA